MFLFARLAVRRAALDTDHIEHVHHLRVNRRDSRLLRTHAQTASLIECKSH